jgi:hypothetical protein
LALLNFGIDEFINPRLRAAGLTRRSGRRRGRHGRGGPAEFGLTPVVMADRGRP